ncbi:MAG TPA: hypothetical protein VF916_15575 [Ktedonobacterales bacterium]
MPGWIALLVVGGLAAPLLNTLLRWWAGMASRHEAAEEARAHNDEEMAGTPHSGDEALEVVQSDLDHDHDEGKQ